MRVRRVSANVPKASRIFLTCMACGLALLGISQPVEAGWSKEISNCLAKDNGGDVQAPVVGDIDGDGYPEIIVSCSTSSGKEIVIYAWHHDGTPVAGWPVTISSFYSNNVGPLTLGELDGLPGLEIIVPYSEYLRPYQLSALRAYRGDGSVYRTYGADFFTYGTFPLLAPVVADLNGDGRNELIVVGYNSVFVWKQDGTFLSGWPINVTQRYGEAQDFSTGAGPFSSPAVADLNRDGRLEVIAVSRKQVYAWSANGADLSGWPVPLESAKPVKASPIVGDLRGDGVPLVVVTVPGTQTDTTSRVFVFNPDGTMSRPYPSASTLSDLTPALADLNGDRTLEIVWPLGSDREEAAAFGFPGFSTFPHTLLRTLAEIKASPVIARLATGARRIYLASSDGRLYAWDQTGTFMQRPKSLDVSEPATPTVADLNGDGTLELVVVGRVALTKSGVDPNTSVVRVLNLGIRGTPEWGTLKGSAQRTGLYQSP